MTEHEEAARVEGWLRARSIQHTLDDLADDPRLCPDRAPVFLELLQGPLSLNTRTCAALAFFARKHSPEQKREAVDALLRLFHEHRGQDNHCLSMLAMNSLADHVEAGQEDKIIRMTLDPRYGSLRSAFTQSLYALGTPAAIEGLRRAARDPEIAAAALHKLARRKVPGTARLCKAALQIPGMANVEAITKTLRDLEQASNPKTSRAPHATKARPPRGLKEWSTNLDGADLPKALRGIRKAVESGFGRIEISEVRAVAAALPVNQEARFKFDVTLARRKTRLWLVLFCDDEEDYDLSAFGIAELVNTIETNIRSVL
jgi:hypothetical protein